MNLIQTICNSDRNHQEDSYQQLYVGILVSAAMLVMLATAKCFGPKKDQLLSLSLQTTLNIAKLTIRFPQQPASSIRTNLIFCVDRSASMRGDRERQVKTALEKFITFALTQVRSGAKISVAIVGFNDKASVIQPLICLTSDNAKNISNKIKEITSERHTDISKGLKLAMDQAVNSKDPVSLVVFTDGDEQISDKDCQLMHTDIARVKDIRLYVMGIGQEHNKELLKTLATSQSFEGKYVDTTQEKDVSKALFQMSKQAIAPCFKKINLGCPTLPAELLSVQSSQTDKDGTYLLKQKNTSNSMSVIIVVNPEKLEQKLDLKSIRFDVAITDSQGRITQASIPWTTTSVIDPSLVKKALKNLN